MKKLIFSALLFFIVCLFQQVKSQDNIHRSWEVDYLPHYHFYPVNLTEFDVSDSYIFGHGFDNGEGRRQLKLIDASYTTFQQTINFRQKINYKQFYIIGNGFFNVMAGFSDFKIFKGPYFYSLGYDFFYKERFTLSADAGISFYFSNLEIGNLKRIDGFNGILLLEDKVLNASSEYLVKAKLKNKIGFQTALKAQYYLDKKKVFYFVFSGGFNHFKSNFIFNGISEQSIFEHSTYNALVEKPGFNANYFYLRIGFGFTLQNLPSTGTYSDDFDYSIPPF